MFVVQWSVVTTDQILKDTGTGLKMHCKSDGGKIQMCFTKLACDTVQIYFFICYLTIQLVQLGGVSPYWVGFQGVSPGWYSKYTC